MGIAQNVVKALPPDISPPMVMRLAPSSIPVAMLEISSDSPTPAELYNLAYMRIRPLLVTVLGSCCRTLRRPGHVSHGQSRSAEISSRPSTDPGGHSREPETILGAAGGDIKIKSTD